MKKILVILPDRLTRSVGGMGVMADGVFSRLANDFEFYIAGFPLAGEKIPSYVKEYREIGDPFPQVQSYALSTLIGQTACVAEALKFPRPDIVFAYDWTVYLSAVKVAKFWQVPLIANMCLSAIMLGRAGYTLGLDLKEAGNHKMYHALCEMEKMGLFEADRIVQVSKGYASLFNDVSEFQSKTRIVPNGIDLSLWKEKKPVYQFPASGKNTKKVIFIGRIADMKGIVPLLKARIPKEIDLILIGDKSSATELWPFVESRIMQSKNIHFIGALYGEEKIRALQSADAIIIPSLHEPFGVVGLEALASGATTISSRVQGLGDYLNYLDSIYCGTTAESIGQALEYFIKIDEPFRTALRAQGYVTCEKYTMENSAQKLKAVFDEVL